MINLQKLIGIIRQEVRSVVDPLLLQERAKLFTSAGGGVLRNEVIPVNYIQTIVQGEINQVDIFYTQEVLPKGVCVVTTGTTVTHDGKTVPVVTKVNINNADHSKRVVGVVMQTTSENSPVRVLKKGLLTYEDGTTFVSGNVVFIGATGKLTTQPPPTGVFLACMGHAVTTTTAFVEHRYVIKMS